MPGARLSRPARRIDPQGRHVGAALRREREAADGRDGTLRPAGLTLPPRRVRRYGCGAGSLGAQLLSLFSEETVPAALWVLAQALQRGTGAAGLASAATADGPPVPVDLPRIDRSADAMAGSLDGLFDAPPP